MSLKINKKFKVTLFIKYKIYYSFLDILKIKMKITHKRLIIFNENVKKT